MVDLDDARSLGARVAFFADLQEVRMFHLDAALDQLPMDGPLAYNFDTTIEVQQVTDSQTIIVEGQYRLVVHASGEQPTAEAAEGKALEAEADVERDGVASSDSHDHQHIAHVTFQLAALYRLHDDGVAPFPDVELDAFGQTTGLLTLHPYARELVASMTGRMGLPTLHLGTRRIPLDKRNPEHD